MGYRSHQVSKRAVLTSKFKQAIRTSPFSLAELCRRSKISHGVLSLWLEDLYKFQINVHNQERLKIIAGTLSFAPEEIYEEIQITEKRWRRYEK